MADSGPLSFQFSPRPTQSPIIVVGVTSQETCRGGFADRAAILGGVERIVIPMRRSIAPASDFIALLRLLWLIGSRRPDVVEFSTPKAGLLGMLAARLRGVPRRVYMMRGLKLERSAGFKRAVLLAAERLACACASNVLCNSDSLRREALALRLAPSAKLAVLGQGSSIGVDIDRFSPGPSTVRDRFRIPRDAPLIGFVGRLTCDKGLPELIVAFDEILVAQPAARLLLVGWFDRAEDALDMELRARIVNNRRIHTTGFVGDTAPYYRAMDVLVLPTWREGFPNAVLEAAATGIPAVTTESTGARDSVVPEVTGLLIPPGYPEAICEAVLKILGDPERRRKMGQAARAWVLEHYAEDRVLGLTADYYLSLLETEPQLVPQRV